MGFLLSEGRGLAGTLQPLTNEAALGPVCFLVLGMWIPKPSPEHRAWCGRPAAVPGGPRDGAAWPGGSVSGGDDIKEEWGPAAFLQCNMFNNCPFWGHQKAEMSSVSVGITSEDGNRRGEQLGISSCLVPLYVSEIQKTP